MKGVYASERWAYQYIQYAFTVTPGVYEVVLHFAETNRDFAKAQQRVFDVLLNDKVVKEGVDIFREAGAGDTAWTLKCQTEVSEKALAVTLRAAPTGPALKGLEVRALGGN